MSQRVPPGTPRRRPPDEEARLEDAAQYGEAPDESFPDRPRNHAVTLPFSELLHGLFHPLNEVKTQSAGASGGPGGGPRRKGAAAARLSPHEQRRAVISRFMARWRSEVGNDIYPALRLVLPDKDRDRGVYGLKENALGRLLVKLLKIDRNSDDAQQLLHWKLPGHGFGMAGDFAGRCFEVLAKRPLPKKAQARAEAARQATSATAATASSGSSGGLRIGQVNVLLDRLALAGGEAEQLPIFETFYEHLDAEELAWLVRIILKDVKIGASERTILNLWHPDGEALFNVSSSLRRVCWELTDPSVRLQQDEAGVALMQCFQPQLAQFQMPASFAKMVDRLLASTRATGTTGPLASTRATGTAAAATDASPDREFWIEEKLDGERMQMHMVAEEEQPGGPRRFRFRFWSRKAKDYTDLYGDSLDNPRAALTQHLDAAAFAPGVHSLILDGEMITWDPVLDKMVAFGTLKTAALDAQQRPHDAAAPQPLFRVFDLLLLNGQPLTRYTLRDRHRALDRAVLGVRRRLEIHAHVAATSPDAIEPLLRQVVADASEGLVLKNPDSPYRLNCRHDDWIKVKPEYMTEFGESLDCLVVGGYYGAGRRGGRLSSFLCGLRVGQNHLLAGAGRVSPEKCLSFFKVGGGFRAEDYAEIRHLTEGKWHDWDSTHPPTEYLELAVGGSRPASGGSLDRTLDRTLERPDVWIRPRDSFVIAVKAASISPSDSFAVGETLRFPRFRRLRLDRAWDSALDVDEFHALRDRLREKETRDHKKMQIEDRHHGRRRPAKKAKRELVIAGQDRQPATAASASVTAASAAASAAASVTAASASATAATAASASATPLFSGLVFCVLSEAVRPHKQSKAQLEALIKAHGGRIVQRPPVPADASVVIVADKKVVKAASLIKAGGVDIVKSRWLFDCLGEGAAAPFRLPLEPIHLLHATPATAQAARRCVDEYGDSFARNVEPAELQDILGRMQLGAGGAGGGTPFRPDLFLDQLEEHGHHLGQLRRFLFRRCAVQIVAATKTVPADRVVMRLQNRVRFGGGILMEDEEDDDGQDLDSKAAASAVTHIVLVGPAGGPAAAGTGPAALAALAAAVRKKTSRRQKQPRIVTAAWLDDCWKEATLVDEEQYAPG